MSQVFKFSGSFILMMMAIILSMGIYLENGSCQEFLNSSDEMMFLDYEAEMPINDDSDMMIINMEDMQSISSFSNSPLGLWSAMNTMVLGEDGTLKKSRESGFFSYGSELIQIEEYSWLTAEDELGNVLYDDGYFIKSILLDAKLPFAVIRVDMITLSDLSLMNNSALDSSSVTNLWLYEDFYESYDIEALNRAFGKSSTLNEVLFRYDPELESLDPLNHSTLDMSMFGDMWSEFADVFNNPEIMKMFNEFAKEQLKRQKSNNNEDMQLTIQNMFDNCDGGVCCKWGTTT